MNESMKNENEKTSIENKKAEIKKDLESSAEKINCDCGSIKLEPETLQWFAWICSTAGFTGSLSDFVNESIQTLFTNHYKLDICVIDNSTDAVVAHIEDDEEEADEEKKQSISKSNVDLKLEELKQTERLETQKLEWEKEKWRLDKEKEGNTLETVKAILSSPTVEVYKALSESEKTKKPEATKKSNLELKLEELNQMSRIGIWDAPTKDAKDEDDLDKYLSERKAQLRKELLALYKEIDEAKKAKNNDPKPVS